MGIIFFALFLNIDQQFRCVINGFATFGGNGNGLVCSGGGLWFGSQLMEQLDLREQIQVTVIGHDDLFNNLVAFSQESFIIDKSCEVHYHFVWREAVASSIFPAVGQDGINVYRPVSRRLAQIVINLGKSLPLRGLDR